MTKYKCDVCKEKHDKMHIVIECSDCYLKGWRSEYEKLNLIKDKVLTDWKGQNDFIDWLEKLVKEKTK